MPTFRRSALYFAWELNHHNKYLADAQLLRAMLGAVRDAGGAEDFRAEFSARLIESGLPANVRADSNRSDLWRDYQQLLKEWSLVREIGSEFRLSALGEVALEVSLQQAVALAVFRFQYPNAYKRKFPLWPRNSRPAEKEGVNWSHYLARKGVSIRPALVIARLLLASDGGRRVAELSVPQLRDRLFRLTTEPDTDEELLDIYHQPPDSDWMPKTTRNASEWVRALVATGLFVADSGSQSLRICESRRADLLLLVERIGAEPLWKPEAETSVPIADEVEDWFEHTQAPSQAPITAAPVSDPPLPRRAGQAERSARIHTRPYARSRRYPTDPVLSTGFDSISAIARQRASEQLHEDIVQALAASLEKQRLSPEQDPDSVDLLVRGPDYIEIFEVKTIERSDWIGRMRLAAGQLLEYQSRLVQMNQASPRLTMVLSRRVELGTPLVLHYQRIGIRIVAYSASTGAFEPLV